MTRIGRNDPCYCGSGNKFKKCCLGKETAPAVSQPQAQPVFTLKGQVEKTQAAAVEKRNTVHTLGVFIFFTTESGDGWVLEISAMDALQVAKAGKIVKVEIEENPETIEVNWSHKFSIQDKKFVVTSYKNKKQTIFEEYPAHRLKTLVEKGRNKFPAEMLEQVHIDG